MKSLVQKKFSALLNSVSSMYIIHFLCLLLFPSFFFFFKPFECFRIVGLEEVLNQKYQLYVCKLYRTENIFYFYTTIQISAIITACKSDCKVVPTSSRALREGERGEKQTLNVYSASCSKENKNRMKHCDLEFR